MRSWACVLIVALTLAVGKAEEESVGDTLLDVGKFYNGYFSEFQKNLADPKGCYAVTKAVYNDVAKILDSLTNFKMEYLPLIVASFTNVVQIFLDHDDVCQVERMLAEAWRLLSHLDDLTKRLDFRSLISILSNIQKGISKKDYFTLGKGVGLFMAKALDFRL